MNTRFSLFLLLLGTIALVESCQVYHNTAARYNAYFLAKEKMLEVEDNLFGNPTDDYNDILQVQVQLDTNKGKSEKANLDYIIEMAAKPIQWHKTSKWVDDSWLLIGKARLYQGDFVNATRSFKYVNSNSEDPNARHQALVMLMRAFTDMEEFENANYVDAFIKKDTIPFSDENARDYHLTRAHFHRLQGDMEKVAQHLMVALPVISENKQKARVNFILGQLYERNGFKEDAYAYYQQVLKNRPGFELETYARVNAHGLQEFSTNEQIEEGRAYYEKLLKDDKYWEYRDKIQYEHAEFELSLGNVEEADSLFNESINVSSSNPAQLAYAYLRLGEMSYAAKEFGQSSLYYDSALQSMPKAFDVYGDLEKKSEVLTRFAKNYEILESQDRLKSLSKMQEEELMAFLEAEYEKDKELALQKKQFTEMREQLRKQQTPPPSSSPFQQNGEGEWYFYDAQTIANGKVAFIRLWGNRKLEDDWRRSDKPFSFAETTELVSIDTAVSNQAKDIEAEEDVFAGIASVEDRIKAVPTTDAELKQVDRLIQESLFKLGKIYYYELEEAEGTLGMLNRLYRQYPAYDSIPEALYLLHGLCKEYADCSSDRYKNSLIGEYPNSLYAKILKNPDYLAEAYEDDIEAGKLYQSAYAAYQKDDLPSAKADLQQIMSKYNKTSYMDKVALLDAMILGKEGQLSEYYQALQDFMRKYEKSNLRSLAQQLANAIPKDRI